MALEESGVTTTDEIETETDTGSDADFDAGFDGSTDSTIDAPTETPAASDAPSAEPEAEQPVKDEKPEFVQLTRADYDVIMRKAAEIDQIRPQLDKAFGKIGGLERVLTQARSTGPVTVTEADFEELAQDFPELAKANAAGLQKVLSRIGGPAPVPDVDKLVAERVAPIQNRLLRAEVSIRHPDWLEQVNTQAFRDWADKLSPQERRETYDSTDPEFVVKQISRFKADLQTQSRVVQAKSNRQKQIQQAAVVPKSAGGASASGSEDDDFNAGFYGR